MTKNTEFTLGKLGKPHGLKGYMYLNHDPFFRKHDLTGLTVFVEEEKYVIHDFKRHLKDRYLIQFKDFESINDIETFRDKDISISSSQITKFMNDKLPWPGFFLHKTINSIYRIKNYFYANELIYLTINNVEDVVVPYNSEFFKYEDGELELVNFDLT
ncbi:MAG: hypothetical protein L7T98_01265 [Candidatus Actinomarina sp.]|nr:hypothetical protein [Candidatus Actinomarina sp.]